MKQLVAPEDTTCYNSPIFKKIVKICKNPLSHFPTTQGCSTTACDPILFFGFFSSNYERRSRQDGLRCRSYLLQCTLRSFLQISREMSSAVLPLKGSLLVSNSYKITPSDQQSILGPILWESRRIISGAMQTTVPTHYFIFCTSFW